MTLQFLGVGLMGIGAVAALAVASGPIDSSSAFQAAFVAAIAVLGAGTLLRRLRRSSTKTEVWPDGRTSLPLHSLRDLSRGIETIWSDETCREDTGYFNRRLSEATELPMREFLGRHQFMLDRFGVALFADLMIRFATVERLVNRALSASSDGAADEAWNSLGRARTAMADCLAAKALEGMNQAADQSA